MARTPSAEYLIVDIETIPDTERWSRPEAPLGTESPFPPTWAHRIIVVGCLWLDHGYRLKRFGVIGDKEASAGPGSLPPAASLDDRERQLLEDFSRFVGRARPVLVTYNGRSFDLPVIVMRSLCHAISLPWYYRDRDIRYRYSAEGHLDLCDWLADHGATRAGKLDAVARLIGLPGKIGVDGSQVEGLYRAGSSSRSRRTAWPTSRRPRCCFCGSGCCRGRSRRTPIATAPTRCSTRWPPMAGSPRSSIG